MTDVKDCAVSYLSWVSFALCSHTSFCSFPLAQMFPEQESTTFCSRKSVISSRAMISTGSLQSLKYSVFPQETWASGVGFWELEAGLCLPCLEAGLSLGWGLGAVGYQPPALPSTAPWGSQRKASGASEGCKLLFKCYVQSHIHVWVIQDSEPLRQNWCGK